MFDNTEKYRLETVKTTFSFIERYGDEKYVDARIKFVDLIDKVRRDTGWEAEGDLSITMFLEFIITDNGLSEDLNRLGLFYSSLQTCIASNACDESISKDFFYADAVDFWKLFYYYTSLPTQIRESNLSGLSKLINGTCREVRGF